MTVRVIRLFFLFLCIVCGSYLGSMHIDQFKDAPVVGSVLGLFFGLILMLFEAKLRGASLRNLSAAAFGLVFGFFMAWMMTLIIRLIPMPEEYYQTFQIVFTLIFCYLGMVISTTGKDDFKIIIPYVKFSREDKTSRVYIVDTSVIIDGRISGICESGFLDGKLVIPRFVLQELQQIADSADDAKRNRGRRGLDMMERLKENKRSEVIVHDDNLPNIKEVDAKLVRLARILDGDVVTNDFNLNKVATLEGVNVLNINDLANALRPVVFPGEHLKVNVKKEGKERNQGVAFMDDGTMIVIDNAKKFVGQNINVVVSSVLQTSAGKMIFANLNEKMEQENGNKPVQNGGKRQNQNKGNRQNQNRGNRKPQEPAKDKEKKQDQVQAQNQDKGQEKTEQK